jgi:alcohol dehydrogenase
MMFVDEALQFVYRNPTKIVFGQGAVKDIAYEVELLLGKRVLVVTDRDLAGSEMVDRVVKSLGRYHVGTYAEVVPDTGVDIVDKGGAFGRELGADTVVSVGGGSSIDTAKGIAILMKEGGQIRDYAAQFNALTRPQTPHIVVPTTAGTGSEVTYAAVIKDHERKQKLLIVDNYILPNTGILDPELTIGLPARLTAATGMDALTHAIEAIHSEQHEPIADGMAMHAIRLIHAYLPRSVQDGKDLHARGQMLIASNMAGVAFGNAQVGIVHAMAHSVGARFGVPHGVANSILLPHGMQYNLDSCPRYVLAASALGIALEGKTPEEVGQAAIEEVKRFSKLIGMPQRLREVKVPEEGLRDVAELTLYDGSLVYNPKPAFDADVIEGILRQAW